MAPPRIGQRDLDLRRVARKEVAKLFGITPKMVETLEREGRLKGERDARGRAFYAAEEVNRLVGEYRPDPKAKRRSSITTRSTAKVRGVVAAAVFACFKAGMTDLAEVSIQTEASPDVIRTLWGEWNQRELVAETIR